MGKIEHVQLQTEEGKGDVANANSINALRAIERQSEQRAGTNTSIVDLEDRAEEMKLTDRKKLCRILR